MAVLTLGSGIFVTFLVMMFVPEFTRACTISSGWVDLAMEQRLVMSPIVVYGRTKQHQASRKQIAGKTFNVIDAVFEVYCVFKQAEEPIEENIIIESISPRDGCSGTRKHMRLGEETIVALKPSFGGKYEYSEIMPTQSANFEASKSNLFAISTICDLQAWTAPNNAASNRCPICGISKFTSNVMDASVGISSRCDIGGIEFADCESLFGKGADNSSVCLPAEFDQTCVRLLDTEPSVTCECGLDDKKLNNHNFFGDIDAGSNTVPCVVVLFTALVAVMITF